MSEPARAKADVIVGLPTDGRVGAGEAVRDLVASLTRLAPPVQWGIVVAHPDSSDSSLAGLPENAAPDGVVAEIAYGLQPGDALNIPYHGLTGRARALHAILLEARAREARAVVLLDPRSTGALAGLDRFLTPLVEDSADFVTPAYRRHPFAGALVHGVVYPVFRTLYGLKVRSPIGPDFGCSRQLLDAVVDEPIWQTESGQIGIDLSLSATAATGGFRVTQVFVDRGVEERPSLDLGTTVSQVVGYLFTDMERRAAIWQRIRGSRAPAQLGVPGPIPEPPDVDASALVEPFRLASRELQDVWAEVLPPLAMLQWRRLAGVPLEAFRVDPALWARTVYDFAMGHRLRVISRDHLLRSLTPLYLAWLASFVLEVRHLGPEEAEARIERLALVFETEKPYLVSQWRWPERFKPVKLRR
jgi:hypothetical protein